MTMVNDCSDNDDSNLMAPDSFKNLGFADDAGTSPQALDAAAATSSQQQPEAQPQDKPRKS
jgi:cytochrome c oxidase assembly protein subunit 19